MKKKKLTIKLDNIILLNSSIYEGEVSDFCKQIIEKKNKNTILMNSHGGCCESGLYLFNIIKSLKRNVKIINTANCSSTAMTIFCSVPKKNRFCYNNSKFFYHEPLLKHHSDTGKPLDFYKSMAKTTEIAGKTHDNILKESGASDKFFKDSKKFREKEMYLNPSEIVEYGLMHKKNILDHSQVEFI